MRSGCLGSNATGRQELQTNLGKLGKPNAQEELLILVHRLRGEPMVLNADLIESIEATPDTIITMVDGRKVVVSDGTDAIVDRIRMFRAQILATSEQIRSAGRGNALVLFPGGAESSLADAAEPE